MNNHRKLSIFFLSFLGIFLLPKNTYAVSPSNPFSFIIWADTENGNSVLTNASKVVNGLNPAFTLYPGDLVKCTASASCWSAGFPTFKKALNGGGTNSIFDKTFATRGNHEDNADTPWRSNFNFKTIASNIGATNYSVLSEDMTYSFDYGNSHFVGIDMPGGDVTSMTSNQITWLDNDLKAAENRGLKHAFLFWHGPIYPVGKHCCSNPPSSLVNVINKHPIIAAGFFGHEMVLTYTHIDSGRISGISANSEFEQFVVDDVGDGESSGSVKSNRVDYKVSSTYGFVRVNVDCNNFTVSLYKLSGSTATVDKTYSFTNGSGSCGDNPTSTPGNPTPTTPPDATPTSPTAGACTPVNDPRDTNNPIYQAVQIGDQCWLNRNENVGTKIDTGTDPKNDGIIEKYCYNNNESDCNTKGGYYIWNEAVKYSSMQGAQGICPEGWHIPTDDEQHYLENYLKTCSDNDPNCCSAIRGGDPSDPAGKACAGAGDKMKVGGSSGFNFMLNGSLNNGTWREDNDGHFWSSTNYNSTNAWNRDVDGDNSLIERAAHNKNIAMSVRCVQNTSSNPPTTATPTFITTPTIYCLGSCNNPTAAPSDQPLPSDGPTPAAPTAIPPAPTAIAIVVIIAVILILFRIAVLR